MRTDLERLEDRVTQPRSPRRDLRWLIAAAAFVTTVAVVGLVAWLGGGEPDPDPGPAATSSATEAPTTVAPTTNATTSTTTTTTTIAPLTVEQTAFVTEYFDAFNAGDVDRYFGLFADGFVVEFYSGPGGEGELVELDPSDPGYAEEAFDVPTFMMGITTRFDLDIDQCESRNGGVACTYWRTDPLIQRVLLRIQEVVHLDVSDGQVTRIRYVCRRTCSEPSFGPMSEDFATWMIEHDAATSEKMLDSRGYPVFTDESARLWLEYLPIYFEEGL